MLNYLTDEEKKVIINKDTEPPYQNEYDEHFADGIYICKQCNVPLFNSKAKFDSGCGWPSFDEEISSTIKRVRDADGSRTEIVCANCGGHLGHVFEGEHLTDKNTRHCVNSVSIRFIPQKAKTSTEQIYFGGGCFWCTAAVFKRIAGVISVLSGYSGGSTASPSYKEVSSGKTGHAEVIKVTYDNTQVKLEKLLEVFFATHDPTTLNQQGNDIGDQYRSVIFYTTLDQKAVVEKYITQLIEQKKFEKPIVTKVQPLVAFYEAEDYHKDYFENNPNQPYCQFVVAPKVEKLEHLDVALK